MVFSRGVNLMILGVKEIQVLGTSGPTNWVFIHLDSSPPMSYDVWVSDSGATSVSYALSVLQGQYPVQDQQIGDIGVVFDADTNFFIFEAQ